MANDGAGEAEQPASAWVDAAERNFLSEQQEHQHQQQQKLLQKQHQSLSPARSGLSAAAAAVAAAALLALELSSAAAAVVSAPVAQLSTRLYHLLMPEGSPEHGGAALRRTVESSAGSFLSARSNSMSSIGSWSSGVLLHQAWRVIGLGGISAACCASELIG